MPRVANPVVGDTKVTAAVDTKTKLVSARLYYTADSPGADKETTKSRKWTEKPAHIEGNRIMADPAPTDAVAWFVTVTDERGVTVSSKLVLKE